MMNEILITCQELGYRPQNNRLSFVDQLNLHLKNMSDSRINELLRKPDLVSADT